MATFRICSIDGCGKPAKARKLCGTHYGRLMKLGSPFASFPPPRKKSFPPSRPYMFYAIALTYVSNECLLWPFALDRKGYARSYIGGKTVTVSRKICEVVNGVAPQVGMVAAHNCGNSSCVNPSHLRWATPKENTADRLIHGTTCQGEKHPNSKLKSQDVLRIREMSANGFGRAEISSLTGISLASINDIVRRKSWRHI